LYLICGHSQQIFFIMALTRQQKTDIISDLKEKVNSQKGTVFVNFSHISTSNLSSLREQAREENCLFKVIKKTLFKLGCQDQEWWNEDLEKGEGSLAAMFGFQDEMTPIKLVYEFAQAHPEVVITGALWQGQFQGAEAVVELATLPDYQALVQQFTGVLQAPIVNFISVLKNNYKGLLYCLNQIKH